MNSSNHQASAAPAPPQAPPTTQDAPCCKAKAVTAIAAVNTAAAVTAAATPNVVTTVTTAVAPTTTCTTSSTIVAMSTCTTTKKRPLTAVAPSAVGIAVGIAPALISTIHKNTSMPVIIPALKSNKNNSNKTKSVTVVKAAKKSILKKTTKKMKKKKFSSILSGMMKTSKTPSDYIAERQTLRKNLGGGNFIKVDKI